MPPEPHRTHPFAERDILDRARTLRDLGRYRELLQFLLPRLHDLDEANYETAACLAGQAHIHLEEFEAAKTLLETVLARNPNSDWVHAELASALYHLVQLQPALKEIRRAIAIDPNIARYHYLEALILYPLWRLAISEANNHVPVEGIESDKAVIQRTLARDPNDPAYRALIAKFREIGGLDSPKIAVRRALALNPNEPCYYELLAVFLKADDTWDSLEEARKVASQGLALAPTSAGLLGLQAKLVSPRAQKLGLLRAALRVNPRHAGRQQELALLILLKRDTWVAAGVTVLSLLVMLWVTSGLSDLSAPLLDNYRAWSAPLLILVAAWLIRPSDAHEKMVFVFMAVNLPIIFPDILPGLTSPGEQRNWYRLLLCIMFLPMAGFFGAGLAGIFRWIVCKIAGKLGDFWKSS